MTTQKDTNLEFVANNNELVSQAIEQAISKSFMIAEGVTFEKVLAQLSWKCGEFRFDLSKEIKKYGWQSTIDSLAMKVMMHNVTKNVPLSDYDKLRASVKRQAINL